MQLRVQPWPRRCKAWCIEDTSTMPAGRGWGYLASAGIWVKRRLEVLRGRLRREGIEAENVGSSEER